MSSSDNSKLRMNLAAIKKVDPYANNIVDSSPHVAFYTFNSGQNEWEKTDVEGAFFIYKRNAQPFHSIFINNRLNTTSFVEPITTQLELQSQPPFLLYRNERSRIRGFWFYNSLECDRIGNLLATLVKNTNIQTNTPETAEVPCARENNVNIFKMLHKAQQDYNNSQSILNNQSEAATSCKVSQFFACAKPTTSELPLFQLKLPHTLSVEQIEKNQRSATPLQEVHDLGSVPFQPLDNSVLEASLLDNICDAKDAAKENDLKQYIVNEDYSSHLNKLLITQNDVRKPALMPPTMFDSPSETVSAKEQPLNVSQFVQAFKFLLQNDDDFVHKLHGAYIETFNKSLKNTHH